jgi:hypothetical protein
MEWLKANAKKLVQTLAMALGLAAAIAYLVPNCSKTADVLKDTKGKVESVVPMLPGEELPK